LVEPDLACFGRKDVQQAILVRQMARDLDWPIEIVIVPTAREPDGLALSSRNAYLSPEDRRTALGLSAALGEAHAAWGEGERSAEPIEARMRRTLAAFPAANVEYIAIADPVTLAPVALVEPETVVAIAARVGSTRLIDNITLGEGIE